MNLKRLQISCYCGAWHHLTELKAVEGNKDISYYCPKLMPGLQVNQLFELKQE